MGWSNYSYLLVIYMSGGLRFWDLAFDDEKTCVVILSLEDTVLESFSIYCICVFVCFRY